MGAKAKYMCQGTIGTTGIRYYHELTDMVDGSADIFGSIEDTTLEASASRYYLPNQLGAQSGIVAITFDLIILFDVVLFKCWLWQRRCSRGRFK